MAAERQLRFIHIADVHLGVVPDAGKPWSEKRSRDIWESFARVIDVAKEEKIDFLFISGDLFHAQPLKRELKEINALFSRIPDTKILLLAGNHDYLNPKSYYLSNEWQENVYFFDREEITCIDFPKENTAIYGLSYWRRENRARCYDAVIPENAGRINVLLAHGGDEKHIPFSAAKLLENGFDYVAAGHIHKGGWLIEGRALMAGSLEPTDCNDTGPHGYWMGELHKGGCKAHFYPIKNCEYCHEIFSVTARTTEQEIIRWARELLEQRPAYQYFRLFIEGKVDPDAEYHLEWLAQIERIVDVSMNLALDYDYEKLAEEYKDTLPGRYIQAMKKRGTDAVSTKALEYGVNALLGHKICR